jgi:hypothetical protein
MYFDYRGEEWVSEALAHAQTHDTVYLGLKIAGSIPSATGDGLKDTSRVSYDITLRHLARRYNPAGNVAVLNDLGK